MKFINIEDFLNNKVNFHTHTTFCDGKDSVEEIVDAAIEKDFKILGISSHAMFPWAGDCHIGALDFEKYCSEVKRIAELKKDKIDVRLGFEVEYIPGISFPTFKTYEKFSPDYLIGSVHYIYTDKATFAVDLGYDALQDAIKTYFGGDSKKCVQEYFNLQRQMLRLRTSDKDFQILGHPDLMRKLNGKLHFFDENDSWYKDEIKLMVSEIKRAGVIVEINVGGIARGYLDTPYPSKEFLTLLAKEKIPVMIASDCHNKDFIDFWFDKAVVYAKNCGVTELVADL